MTGYPRRVALLAVCALALLTMVSFWPVHRNAFILLDDPAYITKNQHVAAGLTCEGFRWAFTAAWADNWPLPCLAHMLDVELFGMNPGAHHLSGLVLHTLTAVLLFAVLRGITGAPGRSFVVAALFAIHPLRVESVAWAAEKKDLVAGFAWVLVMWCYNRYVRRPGLGRYLVVVGAMAIGLTAKPMLVTLPFVLLLLDWWPLGRMRPGHPGDASRDRGVLIRLAAEKVPLLALAVGASLVTYFIQSKLGTILNWDTLPLTPRLLNAALSYVRYLGKAVWPFGLSSFYPHPGPDLPVAAALLSAGALLIVSWESLCFREKKPWLPVGWFWYLGTLIPVIGLVQAGLHGMADRYTYLPLIGPALALCWEVGNRLRGGRGRWAVAPIALLFAGLSLLTWRQTGYWRDNVSIFSRAVEVTADNMIGEFYLGKAYRLAGKSEEAIPHIRAALRVNSRFPEAWRELGMALAYSGDIQGAVRAYRQALQFDPEDATTHNNLGFALAQFGDDKRALAHYLEAVRIKPLYARAHFNAGLLLAELGRTREAEEHFLAARNVERE